MRFPKKGFILLLLVFLQQIFETVPKVPCFSYNDLNKQKLFIYFSFRHQVSEVVPKVPRSTIEERIQQLALEAPKSRPTLDPQPSKSWLLEDRTLSGLDLETSKRMPLPPIPPTPPTMQTPRTQAWQERPEEAVEEEEERTEEEKEEMAVGGAAAPRPDSSAFFMTQVTLLDAYQPVWH